MTIAGTANRGFAAARALLRRLRDDRSGLALIEFAYSLPLLTTMTMAGAELTNFTTTKMRVSQLALHVADNAARMGTGDILALKTISETQINDVFAGANLQGGRLNLLQNGRVILSSVEPVSNPNTTQKFKIGWQRCKGAKVYNSSYGTPTTTTNVDGVGPAGAQVTAPDNGATMFVEISYNYQPLISSAFVPKTTISEIAAMTVRDDRNMTQIYNTEGASIASCTLYTSS